MISRASAQDLATAMERGCQVVDVRTAEEYASGHIPGARCMPLFAVPLRVSELERRRPVYLVCESGGRATQAAQYLYERGYTVYNLDGGMTAWRNARMPVARGADTFV